MALTLKSTAFTENGKIPSRYTCEGNDVSPPLTWEGVPDNMFLCPDNDAADAMEKRVAEVRKNGK